MKRVDDEDWFNVELILGSIIYAKFLTPDLCDWRQFGILLAHIIQGSKHSYHTQLPKLVTMSVGKNWRNLDRTRLILQDGDVVLADILNMKTMKFCKCMVIIVLLHPKVCNNWNTGIQLQYFYYGALY